MWVEGLPHINFAHLQSKRITFLYGSLKYDALLGFFQFNSTFCSTIIYYIWDLFDMGYEL
jgi:hypothetical protein